MLLDNHPTNLGGLPEHLLIGLDNLELNLRPHTKRYVGRYEPHNQNDTD